MSTKNTAPAKLSAIVGESKTFQGTNILKEFMSTRLPLQKILEALLQAKDRNKYPREYRKRTKL